MARSRFSAWALALSLAGSSAAAQQAISLSDALRMAIDEAPDDLAPIEITHYEDAYVVLFAGDRGTLALVLDPASGRVISRDEARIEPRRGTFTPRAGRIARASGVELADQVAEAEKRYDAPLRKVALQEIDGSVVVEVQTVEDGRITGRLVDPHTGDSVLA